MGDDDDDDDDGDERGRTVMDAVLVHVFLSSISHIFTVWSEEQLAIRSP